MFDALIDTLCRIERKPWTAEADDAADNRRASVSRDGRCI